MSDKQAISGMETNPGQPTQPGQPAQPVQPAQPIQPAQPTPDENNDGDTHINPSKDNPKAEEKTEDPL